MRRSFFFLAIAAVTGGTAQADTVSFIPLQTQGVQLSQFSGNGAYAIGSISYTAGFRWTASTGAEELISTMDSAQGINNAGTITGSVPVNGGSYNNGDSLGAYVAVGGVPVQLTSPLQADSTGYGISDDNTVVGLSFGHAYAGVAQAFIWKASTGMQALTVNRPNNASRANVISVSGQVIAGWNDGSGRDAVIWQGGVPMDVLDSNGNAVGEADGMSANGRFVVGSGYTTAAGSGGWRWDQVTGQLALIPNMDFVFGVSNDGKTAVGSAGFFSTTYPARSALIWQDGVGTTLLVDYLTAQGITLPAGWDPDLAGGFGAISGDGSMMGGWTLGPSAQLSYVVKVAHDELFADSFEGSPPSVYTRFSPTKLVAGGAPGTLTIVLTNNAQATAVLDSDFVDQFPFGLVVASVPNATTTCGSGNVVAYSGYDSVALHAGATIPGGGASCLVTVSVTTSTGGDYTNVVPAGALVTSMGANTDTASASVHVLPPGNNGGVYHSGALAHVLNDQGNGSSINLIAHQIDDTGPTSGAWDFNLYNSSGLQFNPISTYSAQVAIDTSSNILVLQPGAVVGPSSTFAPFGFTPAALLAGTDGYVGVAFHCDGRELYPVASGICYGYLHLHTTGTASTGYPATLADYSYDGDGNAITISSTP